MSCLPLASTHAPQEKDCERRLMAWWKAGQAVRQAARISPVL
jgi:hypothetical protein